MLMGPSWAKAEPTRARAQLFATASTHRATHTHALAGALIARLPPQARRSGAGGASKEERVPRGHRTPPPSRGALASPTAAAHRAQISTTRP